MTSYGVRQGYAVRVSRDRQTEPLPPIWARPEPPGRGPRAALSRSQIVQVALLIADEEGLEAVSMRRLARELRSGAMSLYHYFQSRDELLDLMGDTIAAEMLLDAVPDDWRAALKAIAHQSRDAFKRHPWLLTTLQERPRVSPNMLRHIEQTSQSVARLAGRGVEPAALRALALAVDDFMIGYTLRELAAGGDDDHGRGFVRRFQDAANEPYIRYLLESGEFPILSQLAAAAAQVPLGDHFEEGLEWLLDGFAARHGL
jgi:AcrR family transcriptional regulator